MAARGYTIEEQKVFGKKSGRKMGKLVPVPDEGDRLPSRVPGGLGLVGKQTWRLLRKQGWWLREVHTLQVLDACEHAEYLDSLRKTIRARQQMATAEEGGGIEYVAKKGAVPKEYPAHAAYVRAKWEWRQILHELGFTLSSQTKHNLAEKVGGSNDPKDKEGDYF